MAYERLINQEINAEMNIKKERSIHRGELIIELRKIQVLASMHHSLVNLYIFYFWEMAYASSNGSELNFQNWQRSMTKRLSMRTPGKWRLRLKLRPIFG